MTRKLELQSLKADLAAIEALLARTPENDFAGRPGLESRRGEVESRIREMRSAEEDKLANVALFFGGSPVIGSRGIKAEFAGEVISNYQDLVSKIWAAGAAGEQPPKGPVKDAAASQLHVTEIVHGSFGFLLEELDELGTPLFQSPLKEATEKATQLVIAFASERDEAFEELLDRVPARVFSAVRDFLKPIHREEAVFRMVQGDTDVSFDETSVERACKRAESHSLEEDIFEAEGELLGVIPIGRRFEFKPATGEVIRGNVGVLFSQSYLERIGNEQLVGKRWKARINRRLKKSFGKTSEILTLLELQATETQSEKVA